MYCTVTQFHTWSGPIVGPQLRSAYQLLACLTTASASLTVQAPNYEFHRHTPSAQSLACVAISDNHALCAMADAARRVLDFTGRSGAISRLRRPTVLHNTRTAGSFTLEDFVRSAHRHSMETGETHCSYYNLLEITCACSSAYTRSV